MIQVYNILHTENQTLLKKSTEDRTRGHNFKLQKDHCKAEIKKNTFAFRTVNQWNDLSEGVVNAKNINEFKNKLDKQLHHLKYVT